MRKLMALMFILSAFVFAQTNTWVTWKDTDLKNNRGEITGKHISATFKLDSLGVVLLSPVIQMDEFIGVDFTANPVYFRFKTYPKTGANDTAVTRFRVLGCLQNATDTAIVLDTIRNGWLGAGAATVTATEVRSVDSVGYLTFSTNGVHATGGRMTPMIRVSLQAIRRDVGLSYLDLIIKKPTVKD